MEAGTSAGSSMPPASPESSANAPEDPRKRKRITLACARCRRRKGRCDGVKPTCSNCATAGVKCEPAEPEQDGRKRKRANGAGRTSATPAIETGFVANGSGGGGGASAGLGSEGSPQSSESVYDHSSGMFSLNSVLGGGSTSVLNPPQAPPPIPSGGTPAEQDLLDLFAGLQPELPVAGLSGNQLPLPHVQFQEPSPQQNTSSDAPLLLHYHRPFGATAIQPGLEQISIAMRAPPSTSRAQSPAQDSPETSIPSSLEFPYAQFPTTHTSFPFQYPFTNSLPRVGRLFDEDSDIPRPEVLQALYPVFFERLGCHFPFLSMSLLVALDSDEHPSKRVNAPLLINAVCALAARFSDSPLITGSSQTRLPATYGLPFADKAKQILVPLLGYPSPNTVAALLLLAYYEFGLNSEGALWMYSGMCLRMAQDLGLHQDINCNRPDVGALQKASDNLLWWSCVVLDRTLALGTGRPVTIKDSEITAPLPTTEEVATVALTAYATSPDGIAQAPITAFPYVVKFMLLYGQMCEIVNLTRTAWKPAQTDTSHPPSRADSDDAGASRPAVDPPATASLETTSSALCSIEDSITAAYNALPSEMTFTSANFKAQAKAGGGATFLHVHLWYNCILILLYRPPLIYPRSNSSHLCLADRLAVVNNSCLTIAQLLSCAEIVDEWSYLASPFINQCFFVAASAWIQDYRIRTGRNVLATTAGDKSSEPSKTPSSAAPNSSNTILAQVAVQKLSLCTAALDKQARYWLGVGWIAALVNKQGSKKARPSLRAATEGVETLVSAPEMAIFRRLVQRFSRTNGESVPSPELNDEAMNALFSVLAQQDFGGPALNFTPDDVALAYTFASVFPDSSASNAMGGGPSLSDFPFAI